MFIVFEGIDGSGKTTLCQMLFEKLRKSGRKVCVFKKPSKSKIGEFLKDFTKGKINIENKYAVELLFASDLYELSIKIDKKLKEGYIVICDRYYHSSYAYSQNVSWDWLKEIYKHILKPDVTFILDVNPKIALERIELRTGNKSIYERLEVLEKARINFLKLKDFLVENIVYIDSSKPLNKVFNKVLEQLRGYFRDL